MQLRKFALACTIILVTQKGLTQTAAVVIDTNILRQQATTMAQAFINSDYATFTTYTHPRVLQLMGGKDKMIRYLTTELEGMKAEGYSFDSVGIELTPQIVRSGKEIHSLVMQYIRLQAPGGKIITVSYLYAVSSDNGKNWHFMDTAPFHDAEKMKLVFPDYKPVLKIPEKKAPVFIPSE